MMVKLVTLLIFVKSMRWSPVDFHVKQPVMASLCIFIAVTLNNLLNKQPIPFIWDVIIACIFIEWGFALSYIFANIKFQKSPCLLWWWKVHRYFPTRLNSFRQPLRQIPSVYTSMSTIDVCTYSSKDNLLNPELRGVVQHRDIPWYQSIWDSGMDTYIQSVFLYKYNYFSMIKIQPYFIYALWNPPVNSQK